MKQAGRYPKSSNRVAARLAAIVCLSTLVMTGSVAAPLGSALLSVSATVAKRATLKVLAQPATILVTEADLTRGYVEVASPVQVQVQSNSPAGYLLVFESQGDLVSNTRVRGLGNDVQVGASGVAPRSAPTGGGSATHDLVFRFTLSASARQGRHAWPMQVSALPM
jgi:hypothetical protein